MVMIDDVRYSNRVFFDILTTWLRIAKYQYYTDNIDDGDIESIFTDTEYDTLEKIHESARKILKLPLKYSVFEQVGYKPEWGDLKEPHLTHRDMLKHANDWYLNLYINNL